MNQRAVPDEFETDEFDRLVRDAIADVAAAAHPDPGLAERLVAAPPDGRPVANPAPRRRVKRWALPLLAAASVVGLAVGIAVVAKIAGEQHHSRPVHRNAPVPPPTAPTPPARPHFRAADISFADAQHGWALGDARCASGRRADCPALLATSDGGTSWRALSVPKGLVSTFDDASCGTNGSVAGPCVDAVLFANDADGYLWSLHTMYWTTDGGRTWRHYVDPAHDWDGATRMVVAGDAVVRIAPTQQCSSGCPGAIETAPVGTTQWRVGAPSTKAVGLFSSNLTTIASMVYLFAGGTADNASAGIFRSEDGGRNWTPVASGMCGAAKDPEQDPFSAVDSTVADDGALVVSCLGARTGSVRVAVPGSASFSGPRPYPRVGTVELEAARSARGLTVADTSHAFAGHRIETTFYATTDGGRSWRPTATIPVRGDSLRFISGTRGSAIAGNGSGFYLTDDGGFTWRRARFGS
jgi:hypothetical protein